LALLLAVAGFGFIALPGYVYAIGRWSSGPKVWILCALLLCAGVGCLLAGIYFLRLDVDAPDAAPDQPSSRLAPYFLAHRRALWVIALVGFAISLIRLVAVCFGRDWPAWPLVLAWVALAIIGRQIAKPPTMDMDWQAVLERMRPVLQAMVKAGAWRS
jgi:hypothetical protein